MPQRALDHVKCYIGSPFGMGGKNLVACLVDECERLGVKRLGRIMVTDIIKNNGQAAGAVGFNTLSGQFCIFKARSVVLALGHSGFKIFMNRVVRRIVEIDGGELVSYSGDYEFYFNERIQRETQREAAYQRQQAMFAKESRFIERFAAHAAKAAQVQSRVKALEKIEKLEPPRRRRVVRFDFRRPVRSGDDVAVLENVRKAYGRRVVYDGLSLTIRRGERWCVMGRKGAGKTRLLRMVAGALAPDSGEVRLGASLLKETVGQ